MQQNAKAVCTGLGLSIVFAVCLFSTYSQMFVVSGSDKPFCMDGKEFVKTWCGEGLSTVHNIVIKDSVTGHVYYSDGLPVGGIIDIKGLTHGQTLNITWTDWRGPQSEQRPIWCEDGIDRMLNTIPAPPPPPKSMQTAMYGLR